MAWGTPLTAVANVSLTAVQWNASVRDNLNETGPAKATAGGRLLVTTAANAIAERDVVHQYVGTTESSASTTYVDLATAGPAVTVTTGTKALIGFGCYMSTTPSAARSWMSHAISGATTTGAGDAYALLLTSSVANDLAGASYLALWTTLTGGSNTFTAKYKVTSGTGTWSQRRVMVAGL